MYVHSLNLDLNYLHSYIKENLHFLFKTLKLENIFCSMLPDVRKSITLFESSQPSPAFPSDKSSINIKAPEISHWLARNRRQVCSVGGRRLTVWDMARPFQKRNVHNIQIFSLYLTGNTPFLLTNTKILVVLTKHSESFFPHHFKSYKPH